MDITEFQKEVLRVFSEMDKMPGRTKHTKHTALIHLVEEVGEIAKQVTNEYHRPEKFQKDNLGTELVDVLMFIAVLAEYYEIDLSKEMKDAITRVESKIAKIKSSKS